MPPKRIKKNKSKRYACQLCTDINNKLMVQCNSCELKYHTKCLNIGSISDNSFMCRDCFDKSESQSKGSQRNDTEKSSLLNKPVNKQPQADNGQSNDRQVGDSQADSRQVRNSQVDGQQVGNSQVSDRQDENNRIDGRQNGNDQVNERNSQADGSQKSAKYSRRSSVRKNQLELARLEELEQLELQHLKENEKIRREFIENKYQLLMDDGTSESDRRSTDRSAFTTEWVRQQQDSNQSMQVNLQSDEVRGSCSTSVQNKNINLEANENRDFQSTKFRSTSVDNLNPRLLLDSRRHFIKKINQLELDDTSIQNQQLEQNVGFSKNQSAPTKLNSQGIAKRPPPCPAHDAKLYAFRNHKSSNVPECRAKVNYEWPTEPNAQMVDGFIVKNMRTEKPNMQSTQNFQNESNKGTVRQDYDDQGNHHFQSAFDIPRKSIDRNQNFENGTVNSRPVNQYHHFQSTFDIPRKSIDRNQNFENDPVNSRPVNQYHHFQSTFDIPRKSIDRNQNFENDPVNSRPVNQNHQRMEFMQDNDLKLQNERTTVIENDRRHGFEFDGRRNLMAQGSANRYHLDEDLHDDGIGVLNYPVNRNQQRISSNAIATDVEFKDYVALTSSQIAARQVVDKKLPKFSGNPIEWSMWYKKVINTTKMCGLNNGENLERLEKCLESKARDAVQSQLLYPQSVPWIMKTLEMLFGRPEVIIKLLIKKIKDYPPVKTDRLESLMEFAFEVYNISGTIESLSESKFMTDPMLIEELVNKLPPQEKKDWARYKMGRLNITLRTLADWLYELANILSTVASPITMKSSDRKSERHDNKESARVNVHTDRGSKQQSDNSKDTRPVKSHSCVICKKGCEQLENCQKFKSYSVDLRWKAVIEHKLCYKCMRKHKFPCRATNSCESSECQYKNKHHSLLHNQERHCATKSQPEGERNVVSVSNNVHNDANKGTMLKIAPVVLHHNGKSFSTFGFFDDGSTTSMMEQVVADELGLSGTPELLCLIWTKNIHRKEKAERVNLEISENDRSSRKYHLKGVRTVPSLDLPAQSIIKDELVKKYPHLKDVPWVDYENAKPTILIGSDHPKLSSQLKIVEGTEDNSPVASKTRLGWTIHGPRDYSSGNQYVNYHQFEVCPYHNRHDSEMHQQIKEHFSIENFGVQVNNKFNVESQENQQALDLLKKNTRKVNGKYETGLLWKDDNFQIPDSYPMAIRRCISLENQCSKVVEAVGAKIKEYVAKNYARKLLPEELKENQTAWYLPPFGVVHPKKPEKLRMVFDAAAKVKGVSLNSLLLKGPDLFTSLVDILRRFREKSIAVGGDIREMYHQIKIRQADQHYQRFLFRNGDKLREPDVYVMLVMIFGAKCAPFIAQYIKNQNASEFSETHPQAVKSIIDNHYVDDMMDGEHSEEAAIKLLQDVKMIHAHGGFEIRNFLSNSPYVLKAMGENGKNDSKNISPNSETNVERVLGMWWDTKNDAFTFSLKYTLINEDILNGRKLPTKREILRTLMSIFDPLGLLSNYLIHLKIIIQEIWRAEIDWDERISSDNLTKRWKQWLEILPQVENVKIPRLYSSKISPGTPRSTQLHVFVDASEDAFAAIVYLRVEDDDGIDCALIGSKAKVAPLKYLSIPRKELMAAVLGARLVTSIGHGQRLKIDRRVIWSDSMTVLSWLKSNHRKYSQFVAHRVGEILEDTDVDEWRWIPTKENVADEATKWSKPITFEPFNRWFKGPEFIRKNEIHWPKKETIEADVEEEMKPHFVHSSLVIQQLIDAKRFSKWNRMVRALAYSLRLRRLFNGQAQKGSPLSQEELTKAENLIFRQAQFENYPSEMVILERNKNLPVDQQRFIEKPSPLFDGSPYLDVQGVLRMKGRIDGARELSMDTKRPIVLHNDNRITKLLVQHYHTKFFHQNHETVVNEMRQKFYIPHLRVTLKKVRKSCQMCKVKLAHVMEPQMADLPPSRLSVGFRPFSFVGLDFFGPMKVLIGRRVEKRWGVIFTCLTIRAIHIELAPSLDTNSCILCIRNFVADNGPVIEFHSDCGTNFIGANNELQREMQKIDKDQLETTFTSTYTKWSFNPPAAAHMGGSWERLIRSVKSGIDQVMPSRTPKEDVLRNILKEIQNVVNSRPLTFIPLEVEEDEALTPNHFLKGSSIGLKPPCKLDLDGPYLRQSWKEAQRLTELFWKRFVREYLPTLARRTKWFKPVKPIKEGDLVLVVDEENSRNTYPKARVIETKVGSNGQVRRAKVELILEAKTKPNGQICNVRKSSMWRPAHKLAVLDVVGQICLALPTADRETGGSVATGSTSTDNTGSDKVIQTDPVNQSVIKGI